MSTPIPGQTTPPVTEPPAGQAPTGQSDAKSYTQDELNQMFADRVAQERRKYADYGDLKAKATKFDEIEAQNATELDKAIKKADAEARADMSTKTNTRLVRAEVKAAASAVGFHDPADAAVLLQGKFGEVKVTDDGDVDESAVKALVEELAKAKPHLVKTDNGRPAPLPGQGQHQKPPSTGAEQGKAEALKRFGPKTS
jgi:hypothetical protein